MKIIPLSKFAEDKLDELDELDELDPAQVRPVRQTPKEQPKDEPLVPVFCLVEVTKNPWEDVTRSALIYGVVVADDDTEFRTNQLTTEFTENIRNIKDNYYNNFPHDLMHNTVHFYKAWLPKSMINAQWCVDGDLMSTQNRALARETWSKITNNEVTFRLKQDLSDFHHELRNI